MANILKNVDLDIKLYVNVVNSYRPLNEENITFNLKAPDTTLTSVTPAIFGKDDNGSFVIICVGKNVLSQTGDWQVVVSLNPGTPEAAVRTINLFSVVSSGADSISPSIYFNHTCGLIRATTQVVTASVVGAATVEYVDGTAATLIAKSSLDATFPDSPANNRVPSSLAVSTKLTDSLASYESSVHAAETFVAKLGIKTINSESLVGTGNIEVATPVTVDDNLTTQSSTHALSAKQGYVLKQLVDAKLDPTTAANTYETKLHASNTYETITNVSTYLAAKLDTATAQSTYETQVHAASTYLTEHQTLKTVNGNSLLGSGNVVIPGADIDTSMPPTPSDLKVPSTKLFATQLNGKASLSDIPTVNDKVITIKQGGVQKGQFTLNQSTDATINLEAGGNIDTTWPATPQSDRVPASSLVKNSLDTKIDSSAIATTIASTCTDAQVASALAVYTHVNTRIGDIETALSNL